MSRRKILVAMTTTVAILVLADLLTVRSARNSVPRQTMRTIASAPTAIDVLGIGNSLVAAGFDPAAVMRTFQRSGRPCAAVTCIAVNGGLGATGVIEHLALTRLALRDHNVKTVVYGFFDQQMSGDVIGRNSDIIGNRSMLYYLEPQITLRYARFDILDRLSFQLYRSSALLRERGAIWAKVEKLRRVMGSIGMPPQASNQFGRKADFTALEAGDAQAFFLACQQVIQSGGFLSAPVQTLIQQAQDHGAKVIVVEMPMHPLHLKQFYDQPIWEQFRNGTRAAVERAGATYLNASTWIPDDQLFDDHLHLSSAGANQFSQLLATHLIRPTN
jgi:hypothetical protein